MDLYVDGNGGALEGEVATLDGEVGYAGGMESVLNGEVDVARWGGRQRITRRPVGGQVAALDGRRWWPSWDWEKYLDGGKTEACFRDFDPALLNPNKSAGRAKNTSGVKYPSAFHSETKKSRTPGAKISLCPVYVSS